jgi:hypothetical protein
MAGGPVKGERAAPVDADQHDAIEAQRIEPRIEIVGVIDEPVRDVGPARAAHADEVRGEAARPLAHMGHHVAPQMRRGRVAVKEHERRGPRTAILVVHGGVEHVDGRHRAPPRR